MTLKELAQEAGLGNYRGVAIVINNFERRLRNDQSVQRAAHEAVKLMTCETPFSFSGAATNAPGRYYRVRLAP